MTPAEMPGNVYDKDGMLVHGRMRNGLRKVQLIDNLGRVSDLHLTGEGTLREAIGDIWIASREDDSHIAIEHWSKISKLTALCGHEVEVFERSTGDWLAAPLDGRPQ